MKMFELLPRPLGSIFRKLTHLTCNSRNKIMARTKSRRICAGKRRGCFGAMRRDGEKDGSDPISTRRHFAERLDGTGKM